MKKTKKIFFLFVFYTIFLINLVLFPCVSVFSSMISIDDSQSLTITDFTDFYQESDTDVIYSTKTSSEINIHYYGETSDYLIVESYKYDLSVDILDFNLTIKVEFTMDSFSDYLTIYPGIHNSDQNIIEGGLWDPQIGTTGGWYFAAWPNNDKDQPYSSYGISGLSGTFYVHYDRVNNSLSASIKDENDQSTLFSHTWSSGLDTPANEIFLSVYTGTTHSYNSVTFSSINGIFYTETNPQTSNTSNSFPWTWFGVGIGIFSTIIIITILLFIAKKLTPEMKASRRNRESRNSDPSRYVFFKNDINNNASDLETAAIEEECNETKSVSYTWFFNDEK